MTKFLIAIVLLITGVKYTAGGSAFTYNRYHFAELILQGEESEQEKGEHGKCKYDKEDEIFLHSTVIPPLATPAQFLKISCHQDAYWGFVNSPTTPPPDVV
jgi:hypothetical protein